jgi:hypothetical protein
MKQKTAVLLVFALLLFAQVTLADQPTVAAANPAFTLPTALPAAYQAGCENPANPIVAENCQPGTTDWSVETIGGIEGYASATSVNKGESLTFFVNTSAPRFDLYIYRSGYYDGMGGRLIQAVPDLEGRAQPACYYEFDTGLTSCGQWTPSYELTIPDEWVSGVYIAKMVRQDDGGQNFMIFVVRDDDRDSAILYQQSVTTYHAYNYYGGKSLYNNTDVWNACMTVSEQTRAVKVSLNRPYLAPMTEPNMYFHVEYPMVYWLEQQGYDVAYSTNMDTHRSGKPGEHNELLDHQMFMISGHDEYWSQEMRDAITAARDAGVHIGSFSSNTGYWRVRFEPDPQTGEPDSVMVGYKSTQSGPPDPSGHATGTFRDPEGANAPENALLGTMYVGDNINLFFPLQISAEEAQDAIYRNTGLQGIPEGSEVQIGSRLLGWEWDGIVDNGLTPDNLTVLASTSLYGNKLMDAGREYTGVQPNEAIVSRYEAPSGALVFSTGTNQWSWGLAIVEPNPVIQQVTYNLLADMGIQPATPAESLVLDGEEADVPVTEDYFFPDEGSAPVISNIQVVTDDHSASFTWETDTDANGQIGVGLSPDVLTLFGRSDLDFERTHQVYQDFLKRDTQYYYVVVSTDEQGRRTVSDVDTFQTEAGGFGGRITGFVRPLAGSVVCLVQGQPAVAIVGGLVIVAAVLLVIVFLWRRIRRRPAQPTTV